MKVKKAVSGGGPGPRVLGRMLVRNVWHFPLLSGGEFSSALTPGGCTGLYMSRVYRGYTYGGCTGLYMSVVLYAKITPRVVACVFLAAKQRSFIFMIERYLRIRLLQSTRV